MGEVAGSVSSSTRDRCGSNGRLLDLARGYAGRVLEPSRARCGQCDASAVGRTEVRLIGLVAVRHLAVVAPDSDIAAALGEPDTSVLVAG